MGSDRQRGRQKESEADMFVKILVPQRPGEWWLFECERVHYYKLSLVEFWKFLKDGDGFSLTLIHPDTPRPKIKSLTGNASDPDVSEECLDQKNAISVVSFNTKTDQGYTVAFDTVGYLLSDRGRTVERLWTEPVSSGKLR